MLFRSGTRPSLVTGEKPVGAYFAEGNHAASIPPDGEISAMFLSPPRNSALPQRFPTGENGSARPPRSIRQACFRRHFTTGGSLLRTKALLTRPRHRFYYLQNTPSGRALSSPEMDFDDSDKPERREAGRFPLFSGGFLEKPLVVSRLF